MASYRYADIADVSLEVGEVNSAIEIVPCAARRGPNGGNGGLPPRIRPIARLPLVPSSLVADYEPYIERLRSLVAEARKKERPGPGEETAAAAPSAASLVTELERLAALHASQELSDEEFARATRALLASRCRGDRPGRMPPG